jgi:hypothetical protein
VSFIEIQVEGLLAIATCRIHIQSVIDILAEVANNSVKEEWIPFDLCMTVPID